MKNTDPLMGAKLKSKTHLLNTFFDFLSRFFPRLASKVEKSTTMSQKKIFLEKIKKGVKKRRISR
jgi:hypothetical protein